VAGTLLAAFLLETKPFILLELCVMLLELSLVCILEGFHFFLLLLLHFITVIFSLAQVFGKLKLSDKRLRNDRVAHLSLFKLDRLLDLFNLRFVISIACLQSMVLTSLLF